MRILKKLLLNVKTEKRKDNRKKYNETCHVCVGGEGRKINIKDVYFLVMKRIYLLLFTIKNNANDFLYFLL